MTSPCVSAPTNQHQVRSNHQPMILQGSAFKVSHSWISQLSVELRPSSTPSPPSDSQFHYHQASSPSPVPDPGEDNSNSNPKTFISSCIISIHVFLWGLSAKQINIHRVTSLIAFCVSYCEFLQD
ncbi:hypothetical protein ATANTOWER_030893 [Ataeniobius toweri]|uniref:Uncharacterized protein n=1 Tax=Ataeniobius toweri TaxID=208326 RepID=A0ABU7B098_9TELE|nr:hypothetical protein [Ataeniobius toweri]